MTFKKFVIILFIIILLIVGAVIAEKRTLILRRAVDASLYGSYFHYLPCEDLPTDPEVRQVLEDHPDAAQAILNVNPGHVKILVGSACVFKADLVIWYGDRDDFQKIMDLLSEDQLFYGIPVKIDYRYNFGNNSLEL